MAIGILARTTPLAAGTHRLADATVAGCLAMPVALAFRDGLWGLAGVDAVDAGVAGLGRLVVTAGIMTFAAVLSIETGLRVHRP